MAKLRNLLAEIVSATLKNRSKQLAAQLNRSNVVLASIPITGNAVGASGGAAGGNGNQQSAGNPNQDWVLWRQAVNSCKEDNTLTAMPLLTYKRILNILDIDNDGFDFTEGQKSILTMLASENGPTILKMLEAQNDARLSTAAV